MSPEGSSFSDGIRHSHGKEQGRGRAHLDLMYVRWEGDGKGPERGAGTAEQARAERKQHNCLREHGLPGPRRELAPGLELHI